MNNSNNNASTPSTSSSLLQDLLSRPSTSSAPPPTIETEPEPPSTSSSLLRDLLSRPSTSSAPPPTIEAEPEPVVVNLTSDDDMEWMLFNPDDMEWMLFSTAHPNFDPSNPEHIEEIMCNILPPSVPERDQDLPTPSFSLLPPTLPPLPPSPPPPSPAYLPAADFADRKAPSPTSLPQRRINGRKLYLDKYYEVWTWETTDICNSFYLYSLN